MKNFSHFFFENHDFRKLSKIYYRKSYSEIIKKIEKSLEDIITPITVSIIGCVVNGPGEATMTQIGITGGGNDTHMIYINGKKDHRIKNKDLPIYLEKIIRKEAENQKDVIK